MVAVEISSRHQGPLELRVQRPVFHQEDLNRTFGYGKQKRPPKPARKCGARRFLLARVPALSWLAAYDWRRDFPADLVAGITVAVFHVPQGMAYALLGGVPPITGIHMAFYPVLLYALLGTSRHISVGTFAVVCLMTGASVAEHADSYTPLEVASAVSFMVGCYLMLMSVLRLGSLSSLLSDPLVSGFSVGAACHAFFSQLKDLLGVHLPSRRGVFNIPLAFYDLALAIPNTNLTALAVSAITIILLTINNEVLKPCVSKRCSFPIPSELITVVVASLIGRTTTVFEELQSIGEIPTGLQVPRLPELPLLALVVVNALTVAVVAYVIALSLGLMFASRQGYEIDANQEMAALGAASLVGSLFACMPVTASPSRSSLMVTVGGRTQLAAVVSCCGLLVVLLWIGPFFETLPRCVLAAIIVVALKPMLVQVKDVVRFARLSLLDGGLWLLTFLTVVLVDLDLGLVAGVVGSLAILFLQGVTPYTCCLQPLPGTDIYVDTRRYGSTVPLRAAQILQFCGVLNFVSQNSLKSAVQRMLPDGDHSTRTLILDLSAVTRVDPAGVAALRLVCQDLAKRGVTLLLAASNTPVLDALRRCSGVLDSVVFLVFPTTHDAVVYAESVLYNT